MSELNTEALSNTLLIFVTEDVSQPLMSELKVVVYEKVFCMFVTLEVSQSDISPLKSDPLKA